MAAAAPRAAAADSDAGHQTRRRRPRTAASRRAQAARAEGRAASRLLYAFSQLMDHRGCQLTRLAAALQQALVPAAPGGDAPTPSGEADTGASRAATSGGQRSTAPHRRPPRAPAPASAPSASSCAPRQHVSGVTLGTSGPRGILRRTPYPSLSPDSSQSEEADHGSGSSSTDGGSAKRRGLPNPLTPPRGRRSTAPQSGTSVVPSHGAEASRGVMSGASPTGTAICSRVRVVGLVAQPALNGRVSFIIDRDAERFRVRLDAVRGRVPDVDSDPERVVRIRHANTVPEAGNAEVTSL